jgi:hypothetical protein
MTPRLVVIAFVFAVASSGIGCSVDQGPKFNVNNGGSGGTGGGGSAGSGGGGGGTGGNGAVDAGAPLDAALFPPTPDGGANCTKGSSVPLGFVPGATMAPGTACIACHTVTNGGFLYIAGTVYTDYHEGDLCIGVSDVKVQIVDANNQTHTLDVNSSGNFLVNSPLSLYPSPWTVAVTRGSASRPMISKVTSGDCNSCHTVAGTNSAPGRIIAPDATQGGMP